MTDEVANDTIGNAQGATPGGRGVIPRVVGITRFPYYALLLAPTLVMAETGTTHVSPDHLTRPVVVLATLGAVAFGLLGVVTRRWHLAAVMASMGILALLGRWELFFALIAALLFVAWRSVKRRGS